MYVLYYDLNLRSVVPLSHSRDGSHVLEFTEEGASYLAFQEGEIY